MWFSRNQKRIRLSRKLKWGLGQSQHTNLYFWSVGTLCLLIAVVVIIKTNSGGPNTAQPEVLGASINTSENSASQVHFTDYPVSKGETLFTISQKFGLPVETLAQLNDIKAPFTLKAGQTIKVPAQ